MHTGLVYRAACLFTPQLSPVPNYTAWWQRHIGVRNLPRVFTPQCPAETRTHDLLMANPTLYRNTTMPTIYYTFTIYYIYIYYKKENKKRNSEMWQVTYLPRSPTLHYPHQSCHVGWGPGRRQPCQESSKSVQGFWLLEGSKSAIFRCLAPWLI